MPCPSPGEGSSLHHSGHGIYFKAGDSYLFIICPLWVCRGHRVTTCCLCDTIGIADPAQVRGLLSALKTAYPALSPSA